MTKPHPYRYYEAFCGQRERLERLCPASRRETCANRHARLSNSSIGVASALEIARYNRSLRHLELLIAD